MVCLKFGLGVYQFVCWTCTILCASCRPLSLFLLQVSGLVHFRAKGFWCMWSSFKCLFRLLRGGFFAVLLVYWLIPAISIRVHALYLLSPNERPLSSCAAAPALSPVRDLLHQASHSFAVFVLDATTIGHLSVHHRHNCPNWRRAASLLTFIAPIWVISLLS